MYASTQRPRSSLYSDESCCPVLLSFPGGSEVKASAWNVGNLGLIPGSGRSPGEGNGNPLQYSCLENPMEGGAWWAIVHGAPKSRTCGATSLLLSPGKASLPEQCQCPKGNALVMSNLSTILEYYQNQNLFTFQVNIPSCTQQSGI